MSWETKLRALLAEVQQENKTTVAMLVTDYLANVLPRQRSVGRRGMVNQIASILLDEHGDKLVDECGPRWLSEIRRKRFTSGACVNTTNQKTSIIVQMFKHGVSRELVSVETLVRLRTLRWLTSQDGPVREPKRIPSQREILRTCQRLPTSAANAVKFMMLTGCRPGEAYCLTPNHLSEDGTLYLLRQHKTDAHIGQKVIPLSEEAIALLRSIDASGDQPYFRNSRGNAWGRDSITKVIHKAAQKAGVEYWVPSAIRHAVARHVRDAHGIEAARALLGHTKAGMTQHYAGLDLAAARQAVESLSVTKCQQ